MSRASELHDLLSGRFVRDVIGPAIKGGATYSELMVLFESCQFGMMEVLHRHYELAPAVASGLCEASIHRAIERFAAERNKDQNNG
ncbi:hypothetical protein OHD62_17495 [Mesorhizobium sp. YC-39]|uniref:hypothetical protein n=1 Tax=unclassified Mesorhizobium TaxID=325217 RepID=UPI0021E8B53C|nr:MULTISPECIES: hypothetical protein [unclassified Mesorhizobium]MCV3209639.1 hypothetical protein [Mesorhizobium sp. YC-2]MCV3230169.1 hypothetical protein [Mesorhizobium sp. YC-39]